MKNLIYFFTGTGNSYSLAKSLAKTLPNCEIVGIHRGMEINISVGYDRIGFIYPVYYQGLPAMLEDFIQNTDFPRQEKTYYFAVATYGLFYGNSLPQLERLLYKKEIHLNYATTIKMFSNCVTMYNMSKRVQAHTAASAKKFIPISQEIKNFISKPPKQFNSLVHKYYSMRIGNASKFDIGFHIEPSCISCGTCVQICPAENIRLINKIPVFQHRCENCNACIQHCPNQSIQYKRKTQGRRRYTNPDTTSAEISEYYTYKAD